MEAPARTVVAPSTVWRGRPYPLGATWDGAGVNFALFSKHAERVELCLFDPKGRRELERVALRDRTDFVWHCYLPDARPGLLYGYRVYGPDKPEHGHRFDPGKVLLDPYARLIKGKVGAGLGRCQVVDTAFSWGDDRPPRTPWQDTVLYELHVKGFTRLHPGVPEQLRGTYAALATAPVLEHLQRLGVTAVQLLPVHAFVDERRLVQHGLRNYWGYNSIGFFAPEGRYCASGTLGEFKTMVKTLHAAGIEVILDVVYNHTAEGDHTGPTLSFRGIDNLIYYRLDPAHPRRYLNFTGTGNSFNAAHRVVLALIMDSLRYWVQEMHVDGFRFDLATTLARNSANHFDRNGAFLSAVRQDPVLSQVKLIAEPWDVAEGGYQLGNFPPGWAEWNDKYRDAVRSYWKGDGGIMGELASRLSGSSDIFQRAGRGPTASINFVTAHDGFTLHDLVSYERKHNEANLEANRDGSDDNRSWNGGVEGPSDEPHVRALRERQKRNLLATLFFSQGVPMLLAGDEMGRTQRGNNNAYCQDNALSWIDWELDADARALLGFTARLIRLRNLHPLFRRRTYFRGRAVRDPQMKDISWLNADGAEMSDHDWSRASARCLGVLVSGRGLAERDERGRAVEDDDVLLLLNAHADPIDFALPGASWRVLLDSAEQEAPAPAASYPLQGRSAVLLVRASRSGPARRDA
ncbi:MAG TPA: glycogen debranching protein GlgX [Burkholderiales bacterium]|nr:glycogen debranching protein GlgX [Burkholderiales bacterium]